MPVIEGTNMTLTSVSLDAKTKIILGENNTLVVDELNSRIGIGVAAPATTVGVSGEANCSIVQEREATAATAGRNTLIQAGGAVLAGTNLAGGTLQLAAGIATGQGDSKIEMQVATPGGSGTTDAAPATVLTLDSVGLVFTGEANRSIEVGDSTAAAGGDLSLTAGAGEGTDKAGGNLALSSGVSTGTGTSKVTVATCPAAGSGTVANTPATALEVRGDGSVIAGRQAALLAQAATAGFMFIPATATGDPSGTPASIPTGQVPITFIPATGKLAVYNGSAWKLFSADV